MEGQGGHAAEGTKAPEFCVQKTEPAHLAGTGAVGKSQVRCDKVQRPGRSRGVRAVPEPLNRTKGVRAALTDGDVVQASGVFCLDPYPPTVPEVVFPASCLGGL